MEQLVATSFEPMINDAAAWANASSTTDGVGRNSKRLEQAVSSILSVFGLQIGTSCLGIMGALQYSTVSQAWQPWDM
jgi:hypothetical protein